MSLNLKNNRRGACRVAKQACVAASLAAMGWAQATEPNVLSRAHEVAEQQFRAMREPVRFDGLVAPNLATWLQTGNVALIPDDVQSRGLVYAMIVQLAATCGPVDSQFALWTLNYTNQQGHPSRRVFAIDQGAEDARRLIQQFGCQSAVVDGVRRGIRELIAGRMINPPQEHDPRIANLLSEGARQQFGLPVPPPNASAGTQEAVLCWRTEVGEGGRVRVPTDLRTYNARIRASLVDAALRGPRSVAAQVVSAGLYPVIYVAFPERTKHGLAVEIRGAPSYREQNCRYVGYEEERVPLR